MLTSTPKKPKRRVEDITTWMEAFSIYCLILTSFFPQRSKDLLQYKLLILRTYRQFSGKVWLAYGRAFREHAAAAKVVDWSSINVQLFNFHAAGALACGPTAVSPDFPELVGASSSQNLCRSWNSGHCVALNASCPSVFQLLWHPLCGQLPRTSASPVSIQFQTPLSIPTPLRQQVAANMNGVWTLSLVHRACA